MAEAQQQSTTPHTVDQIEADENQLSDIGSSIESSDLTSLSSSIRDHVYENGRRYHSLNAGTYNLPNDESEQERLDMNRHAISMMLDGELHIAPLPEKLNRILDVGTGTGIWAIDMADQHPEAQVIGVDLSPIQPTWVPPNCVFEVDDIEKPWLWKQPFDFIHSSNLAQGIHDWPLYTKRIYDNLTPGGKLEQYQKSLAKALELAGIRDVTRNLEPYLRNAGFVDIKVVLKKMPFGPWAKDRRKKDLGRWGLAIVEPGLKSYGLALFTRQLGMSSEDALELCEGALKEIYRPDVHTYGANWFIEGRKPEDAKA